MSACRPRVTALVPSYNHARYIQERIESILNQTYSNIELIVIDDCSDDESHAVITQLMKEHNFRYLRNMKNSGSPFSAWNKICSLATGDFIWICESDDVASVLFLEVAVKNLVNNSDASMFYCNSYIIDRDGKKIGHTDRYFHDIWKEDRWDNDFYADGYAELIQYQMRGQTVPNMSSALFTAKAFKAAFNPFVMRLQLTGDWLFVGEVMKQGDVIFKHEALSYFRDHEVTSRARVKSARSQAEFILTKYRLFRGLKQPYTSFAELISTDAVRFLYEEASWFDVLKMLVRISLFDSIKCFTLLFISTCNNACYISKFRERYKHSKSMENT